MTKWPGYDILGGITIRPAGFNANLPLMVKRWEQNFMFNLLSPRSGDAVTDRGKGGGWWFHLKKMVRYETDESPTLPMQELTMPAISVW